MRNRTKGLTAALALAASGLAVGLGSGVAAAQTSTPLPITFFHQIVADPANGHLFISEGVASVNDILVTNLAGQEVTTIGGQDGVEGIALSPDGSTLYAALRTGDAVTAISTTTLEQTASYQLPAGDSPMDIAVQSGKVWVSYDTGTAGLSAIGDIDLTAASPAFGPQAAMGRWYSAPEIAGDPRDSGVLVAALPGSSPASVASYNVSANPVTVNAQNSNFSNCDNEWDLAVVPGGSSFILACGFPDAHYRYSTADLSQQGSYASASFPDAVAIDASGDVAAGVHENQTDPDVYVYQQGGQTPVNTYSLPGSGGNVISSLATRGLAWNPGGSQLFAVMSNYNDIGGGTTYNLDVIEDPALTQPALTLMGPSTAQVNNSVTLTGGLTVAGGTTPIAGATITVSRSEAGSTAVKDFTVTTAADGSFSLTDTPPGAGQYTYTANYAGTSTIAPATASQSVTVTLIPTSLTLAASPSTVQITKSVTLTGDLTVAGGTTAAAGATITISRSEAGSTAVRDFTVTTAADGSFSLTDTPPGAGQYTYTANYAGTSTIAPATASQSVTVTLIPTSLTLAASPSTATYEPTIHVTAHLGATYTGRTVSIYAQPFGSSSRRLLRTGNVNSSGNLSVSYRAAHSTTFSAAFSGDARYAPTTVSRAVHVRADVSESLSGYYRSQRIRGETYRLFHRKKIMYVHVAVAPDKYGECVEFTLQVFYQGAWSGQSTGCGYLSKSSKLTIGVKLTQASIGYRYRIRADYLPGSDTGNLGNDSPWAYFIVEH